MKKVHYLNRSWILDFQFVYLNILKNRIMSREEIYKSLIEIEKSCEYREFEGGGVENFIDTNLFYNRVKGLMLLLKQFKDE
jgi:hypothetical protein